MKPSEISYSSAVAEYRRGRFAEGKILCQEAISHDDQNAHAWHLLGVLECKSGDFTNGISLVERAISIAPQEATFYANLGSLLLSIARRDEAERALRRAIELAPALAAAWTTLGYVLGQLNRSDEAIPVFLQASLLDAANASALDGLGHAYAEVGLVDQSIATFERAAAISADPRFRLSSAVQLPLVYQSAEELLQWRNRLIANVQRLRSSGMRLGIQSSVATPVFSLAHQGFNDREIMQSIAQLYEAPAIPAGLWRSSPSGRLRIGFLSSYFGSHTIGKLARGLIAELSQRNLDLTIFSVDRHMDEVGTAIAAAAANYVVVPRDLDKARAVVLENSVDVLVYTDLGMDHTTFTLAFSRLAPIQCSTWGHPDTSGIPTIDYFISSELMEVAEAEAHYSEKLIRLRGLTFVFQKTPVPAAVRGREAFGLAATKRLYGCPQAIYKCHPDFDQALAAILRRDPEGQIVLIRWTYSQVDQQLRERFRRTMPEVADRIIFLDRLREPEFMNLLTLFDVMIDPFPYGGGNTSLEAFSVGLPVVTFPTQFLRGRITAAFCRKLGLDSCIASSIEEYVEMAVRLAMDPSARREVSAQIMARQQLLFDDQSVVDDWEHFFREIGSAGAAPPHVDRPGC